MIHQKLNIKCEGSQPDAALYTYLLDSSAELAVTSRPLIIVCPGGAYAFTSDREAESVAIQFNAMGCHAAVLRYSVAPARYPTAILELGKAMTLLRENAKKWHIDPENIIPLGFSAGGHMVADFCMEWQESWLADSLQTDTAVLRPNGMILGYPVITSGTYMHEGSFRNLLGDKFDALKDELSLENRVSSAVPRSFIWNTYADESVPVQNALLLVSSLVEHHIPVEYHMFEKGGHGLSLANEITQGSNGSGVEASCACWIELVERWLRN